jgi:glycosyltransferase involved in cell wall biosynthesis
MEKIRLGGLESAVRLLGRVDAEDLSALYRRASVYVMPSCMEGFGVVYAEAMWHGLPCVGSPIGGAAEIIVDGTTGVLVPYNDVSEIARAVCELLSNPARARRMGEEGRRRAREHYCFSRFRSDLLAALDLG